MWNNTNNISKTSPRTSPNTNPNTSPAKIAKYAILGTGGLIAGVFGLSVIFGSWYTIDQRERGIKLRNGALIGVAQPGLGFKIPIIDSVVPIKVESFLVRYEKQAVYSKDQQPAEVTISIGWRAIDTKVDEVYTTFGSLQSMRDRAITPKVLDELKNVFGQYNAATAIQDRTRLGNDVQAAIVAAVKGPFIIENVQIENIDFSDAYEKSIEQRMLAEVEVQRIRQNLEREKVNAEILVTQAKAQADSVETRAKADAEAIRMRGEAEALAIRARGDALRANAGLVELTAAERWDGKLPTTMVPGSAVPFLPIK